MKMPTLKALRDAVAQAESMGPTPEELYEMSGRDALRASKGSLRELVHSATSDQELIDILLTRASHLQVFDLIEAWTMLRGVALRDGDPFIADLLARLNCDAPRRAFSLLALLMVQVPEGWEPRRK